MKPNRAVVQNNMPGRIPSLGKFFFHGNYGTNPAGVLKERYS